MKLRKHKATRTFRITWTVTGPSRTETHVDENGKARKVKSEGVTSPRLAVITTGNNPTSVLNAFLFGRDRTAITAQVIDTAYLKSSVGKYVAKRTTEQPVSVIFYRGLTSRSFNGVSR